MLVDVRDILEKGEFFYADCIVTDQSEVLSYMVMNSRIETDRIAEIDINVTTSIFQNFSVSIEDSVYVGGEAAAHGSCGFFYKKTGDVLNWFLMSTESDPFVSVDIIGNDVVFLSESGCKWFVCGGNIKSVVIKAPI